jgi:hypothetical protein
LDERLLFVDRRLGVTRVSLELRLINSLQLWAAKTGDGLSNYTSELTNHAEHSVGLSLSGELVGEAGEVVALEKGSSVEDTASEVLNVDTGEGVGCSGVTREC